MYQSIAFVSPFSRLYSGSQLSSFLPEVCRLRGDGQSPVCRSEVDFLQCPAKTLEDCLNDLVGRDKFADAGFNLRSVGDVLVVKDECTNDVVNVGGVPGLFGFAPDSIRILSSVGLGNQRDNRVCLVLAGSVRVEDVYCSGIKCTVPVVDLL